MHLSSFTAFLLGILFQNETSEGANILAITPMVSPSHGIWNKCLLEALAEKGHQVTILSPFEYENSTRISYHSIGGKFDANVTVNLASVGVKEQIDTIWQRAFEISELQLRSDPVRRLLIENQEIYDLIILEMHFGESFAAILQKFEAPIVAINAFGDGFWNWDAMGVENFPSTFSQPVFPFSTNLSFSERVANFLALYYEKFVYYKYLQKQQSLAYDVFGNNVSKIEDVVKNLDLFLINSGPQGLDLPRFLPPNVKEVGCLQCRQSDPRKLHRDVRDFLDNAKEGFVFMSFGTNVKISLLPRSVLENLMQVLSKLKMKVLWKFENDDLPGKPENVMIRKWLSQQDVIGHKNIRLFITHGGRLSIQEAVYHGVPLVVIPFYIDQHKNAATTVRIGLGVKINILDSSIENFEDAIHEVLNNNRFKESAQNASAIARDKMNTPLEEAVFWIEHIIHHKGGKHLRPASGQLNFIQLHSLDVVALLLILTILLMFTIKKCSINIVKYWLRKHKEKKD